ncbi:MAG: EAL domain-containing protein [Lachnospiraceae bacterium]|nr:EAL domain-containing protein [Lachnospiraceae bacterium]
MDKIILTQLHESAIMIATLILGVCLLLVTLIQGRTYKRQNRIFCILVLLIGFNSLTSIGVLMLAPFYATNVLAAFVVRSMHFLYFITHPLLGAVFFAYVLVCSGVSARMDISKQIIRKMLYRIPAVIILIMGITNPLTHFVYTVSDNGLIRRGSGEMIMYVLSFMYFAFVFVVIILNWGSISRNKKWTVIFFLSVTLTGIVLQLLFQNIRSELFAEMIGLTGMMILVENEDDRMDLSTGVYNRAALVGDLKTSLTMVSDLNAICVRITNAETLRRLIGTTDNDVFISLVSDYLKSIHPRSDIYRTTPDSFVLIYSGSDTYARIKGDEICRRFDESFEYQDANIMLSCVVMCADVDAVFERRSDLMLMCDGPLPAREKGRILKDAELNYLVRRAEVESALHRGLTENRFEVYYQPVYRTKGMSIYSAEALLRLKDSKLGNIMPDEFIPIAEQNGLIDRLGEYVLEEVCLFLSSGIPTEMGLDCIEINLSVLQCLQPGFVERIRSIVRKYDVMPRFINFEVTESAAASDYAELDTVLGDLKASGFLLSLDDYGVGYSNVMSVFSIDFDVIKIDKSILWEAVEKPGEEKSKGFVILENTMRMIREMDLKILVEGVETQDQVAMLEELNADYLQGYYFSRPVSKNELLGILRVTELTRMEEQRARAISEAKSNFLANMSHEIRTPINAILGMNEMILRESKNTQILDHARSIESAGRTLISLINDILDFSKIESGSMEIAETEYDLSSVVNDVVNMIQVKADEKHLEFLISVNPDIPDTLFGDGMRLRQIMVNILNNAVKYTAKGSVKLEIDGNLSGRDRLILSVAVTDTGIGIKEEDIGKLFGKFQRFDSGHTRNIEGSGLGLAITYSLLQIMHGEIECRSVYGEGSTFTIHLPQRILKHENIGDFRSRYLSGNTRERASYKESFRAPEADILVVDDTPVNHLVIKELLKQTRIRIDTAMSGKECLEMVANKHYDVILLDFRMPEMDGIETLHIMKSLGEYPNTATPVVALSANAVTGARERFLNEGFDEYMIKPVEGPKLEEMLIRFLPPSKVLLAGSEPDGKDDDYISEGDSWLRGLEGLDTASGIKNCGSVSGYRSVLEIYISGADEKAADIERCFKNEDWEAYTIHVHSLKSSSRVIGANELSKMAADLEKAGNELDIKTILSDTDILLKDYRKLISLIGKTIADDSAGEEEADADKPFINADDLHDAYATMLDFAKMFDYDNMLFVLDSLKDYRLDPADSERLEKIRSMTEEFKWDEIADLISKIL